MRRICCLMDPFTSSATTRWSRCSSASTICSSRTTRDSRPRAARGDWAKHAVHLAGTRDDDKAVTALRTARFGGLPFARHYEALAEDADVLQALAGDRYGIGLVWFVDAASVPREVRL